MPNSSVSLVIVIKSKTKEIFLTAAIMSFYIFENTASVNLLIFPRCITKCFQDHILCTATVASALQVRTFAVFLLLAFIPNFIKTDHMNIHTAL